MFEAIIEEANKLGFGKYINGKHSFLQIIDKREGLNVDATIRQDYIELNISKAAGEES